MVTLISDIDYAEAGLDVEAAMLAALSTCVKRPAPPFGILWGGKIVQTGDRIATGRYGRVRIDIGHHVRGVRQGIDLKVNGYLMLGDESKVELLRTWADESLEDSVEYPFHAKDGVVHVWNVFERTSPMGEKREEKWTGNAGFWVEHNGLLDRTYHCSHGMAQSPEFDALIFRVRILPVDRPVVVETSN